MSLKNEQVNNEAGKRQLTINYRSHTRYTFCSRPYRTWVSPALQLCVLCWIDDIPGQNITSTTLDWTSMITACHQMRLLGDFEPRFTAHAQKRPEYYFRYQIWTRHSIRHARKPICVWNCGWKCCFKGTLRHVCTAHAQKGQNTTSGFRFDHAIRSGMVENLYSHEIVAKNALLGALWAIFLLRMRRNGHNTTSGIKSDHAIRSGMPENLYTKEILAKNAILWVFSRMSNFCPIICIGDFLRMRVKPEVVVRFWCPTNSSSQFWSRTTMQNLVTIG